MWLPLGSSSVFVIVSVEGSSAAAIFSSQRPTFVSAARRSTSVLGGARGAKALVAASSVAAERRRILFCLYSADFALKRLLIFAVPQAAGVAARHKPQFEL